MCYTINTKGIILSEISQEHRRTNIVGFHLPEELQVVILTDRKLTIVVAGVGGRRA